VRRRSRRPSISAGHCGLIAIEVNRHTIDLVRDPLSIRESVFVRLAGAGKATGNSAVSFLFWD
jgi:hypothetical protein